jgi:hypothetical protein
MDKIHEDENFTTYKGIHRLGSIGDFGAEYWTEEDWEKHRAYIKELEERGELGKEIEITIHVKHNPILDKFFNPETRNPETAPLESHRLIFLDGEWYDGKTNIQITKFHGDNSDKREDS